MAEAFKFAYAKRSELGDEEYVEGIEEVSFFPLNVFLNYMINYILTFNRPLFISFTEKVNTASSD